MHGACISNNAKFSFLLQVGWAFDCYNDVIITKGLQFEPFNNAFHCADLEKQRYACVPPPFMLYLIYSSCWDASSI